MKAFEIDSKETVVFYLHGLRGHAFAQESALRHMVRNLGVNVVSLELPGHGKDALEQKCMVPKYASLVNMIVEEIEQRSTHAEQVILMGYSFGGALMALAADRLSKDASFEPKVAGFIGISAAFDVGHNVDWWKRALVGAIAPLSRFLFRYIPKLSHLLTIREMDVSLISPDLGVQASIAQDNLVYKGRIPLNTSAQVYKAGIQAFKRVGQLGCPVLLVHSKDDSIALAPEPDSFSDHVTLRLFNSLRHNCIDGVNREAAVSRKYMMNFIVDKL